MTRTRLLSLLTVLLAAAADAGCSLQSCTEASCSDSLTINLSEPLDVEQAVTLELEVAGHLDSCEITTNSARCGAAELIISNGKLASLNLAGAPSEVKLRVFRQDENLIDHTFSNIEYSSYYANGDDCPPPACHSASVEI